MENKDRKKFLIIQTAFIGDVILATPLAGELKRRHPDAEIHFLVRKGNESVLENNPDIFRVWAWEKREKKYSSFFHLLRELRKIRFDGVYNCHRFLSSGILTLMMKSKEKSGFQQNPLSVFFSRAIPHSITGIHETSRNLSLLPGDAAPAPQRPRLYPPDDNAHIREIKARGPYIVIAPASVWFTKQLPAETWREFILSLPLNLHIVFVGAQADAAPADLLATGRKECENLCGKISLLQAASLMKDAVRVFCNDSAPLHLASSVNAPVTAIFCSTVPEFGFGPLSDDSIVIQAEPKPECKPCGLHGKAICPQQHFLCGKAIRSEQILNTLK